MLILIADDQIENIKLMQLLCERDGHDTIIATNAEQAIELAETRQPDLIVMDVYMPGKINGIDGVSHLRDKSSTRHIPIIVTTAGVETKIQQAALKAGANVYIRRPIKAAQWRQTVQDLSS